MPTRELVVGDGIAWLRDTDALPADHAIVTSVPDVSEMPPNTLAQWRELASEIVELACTKVHPQSAVVLYQTDIKVDGRHIDKAYVVARGAERAGAHCLWHKIVCRTAPGNTTFGRPAYGHWLAYSKALQLDALESTPDVLPELEAMTWARATPLSAAQGTCEILRRHTACRVVVDPFCGWGTNLAVANAYGFDAVGVELSAKRARKAGRLEFRGGAFDPGDTKPDQA